MDGGLNTSPIPPPFLKPWFIVVIRHNKSVSQARSLFPSSEHEEESSVGSIRKIYKWNDKLSYV